MATAADVKKLAALARIRVEDNELEKFTKEFDEILAYVGQLAEIDLAPGAEPEKQPLRNSMREDGVPHASGAYTEKLVTQFPAREGDALLVKQIISHGKEEAK